MYDPTADAIQFRDYLENVLGFEFLRDDEDGGLSTFVHTGRIFDSYNVRISFMDNLIRFVTESGIGTQDRLGSVKPLLQSINACDKRGRFFINEDGIICAEFYCTFEEVKSLDNSFDSIDYGIDMFNRYGDAILKSLIGGYVRCVRC